MNNSWIFTGWCSLTDLTILGNWLPSRLWGTYAVDRCDAYRHFAAKCVELARGMDSARDRLIMLEMALLWSRLAEYAAKTVARKERTELEWPASVDGNAQRVG